MDNIGTARANWSWRDFREVTAKNCNLLKELNKFPDAILVTGCQRSGTTILSRIITESEGMVRYWFGPDDELDAALILSGIVEHKPQGRYCFQTTYLDHCYEEYFGCSSSVKIVWVLRNPYSTVYSLVHNWPKKNFERTFQKEADHFLEGIDKMRYKFLGVRGFSEVMQGCFIYNWKISQLFHLVPGLGHGRIMVVDYDKLVLCKEVILPKIYDFIELDYKETYSHKIHSSSVNKKQLMSEKEYSTIKKHCNPIYQKAKEFFVW